MTNSSCEFSESELCRDESTAFILKFVAMASILVAGFTGIAIPLFGKRRRLFHPDGEFLPAAKAFAAGVILATGFVHMLNDAWEALNHPCLKSHSHVWSKFPFTGFFAMMSALFTLLVDFVATQYYEGRHRVTRGGTEHKVNQLEGGDDDLEEELLGSGIVDGMHIVGMHAHASHHTHSHPRQDNDQIQHGHHEHAHSQSHDDDDVEGSVRHVVVSQVTLTYFPLFSHFPLRARNVTFLFIILPLITLPTFCIKKRKTAVYL